MSKRAGGEGGGGGEKAEWLPLKRDTLSSSPCRPRASDYSSIGRLRLKRCLSHRVILEEHRKNCEAQGKYVEAEIAKNRLEELRQHEFSRRKEALRSRQIAERLGVEEAHMLEFQQFNAAWDKKFQEYETKAAELEEKMKVSLGHYAAHVALVL
eukprot:SAG31_NODE_648_length_13204_cov_57.612908_3_plen_154_part_00